MIKSELIDILAKKQPEIPETDIATSVNLLIDYLSSSLSKGARVEIRGFGSFSLHYRPARNAHNPKTGSKVTTAPKYTPHFKPGKELRELINDSKHRYQIVATEESAD